MQQPLEISQVKVFRRLLRKLEREFNSQLREKVECCGVSVIQCHTLLEIEDRQNTSMKEISDFFRIDKSTISRTIDILVKKGYVSRVINDNNRRFMDIKLTEEGEKICKNINLICDKFYSDLLSLIPDKKLAQLFNSFSLFTEALKNVDEFSKTEQKNCICNKSEE